MPQSATASPEASYPHLRQYDDLGAKRRSLLEWSPFLTIGSGSICDDLDQGFEVDCVDYAIASSCKEIVDLGVGPSPSMMH